MKIASILGIILIGALILLSLIGGFGLITWIGMMIVGTIGIIIGGIFNIIGIFIAFGFRLLLPIIGIVLVIFIISKIIAVKK
ncbi:TPA: hypothetical protein KRL75_004064 [Clostridioides difficile]|nr:hypothetical protein [Clostridioides difficile]HBG8513273.1 hypothetical protein [Clostridioides difficile]HBH1433089.1 hypothetical protein [Clostridioides difficile]HBH1436949.1 hypothetical protein [Clostridioides difficile]